MTLPDAEHSPPSIAPPPGAHPRRLLVEVLLVVLGGVLGLAGEGWRQAREHRHLADETLRRVRAELVANREAVEAVEGHHAQDLQAIQLYLKADAAKRSVLPYPFRGTHPAFLQYAAWDVAIATQSLDYLDRDLTTSIARVYAIQRQLDDHTRDISRVMYANAGGRDAESSLAPFAIYFGDCTLIEPRLESELDSAIQRIDRSLKSSEAITRTR